MSRRTDRAPYGSNGIGPTTDQLEVSEQPRELHQHRNAHLGPREQAALMTMVLGSAIGVESCAGLDLVLNWP